MKTKKINVAKELAALRKMSPAELRERYADLYGEPTRSGNRQWLVRRCAWRIQALSFGNRLRRISFSTLRYSICLTRSSCPN